MRGARGFGALAATMLLAGCHWIVGFDGLTLREDARLVWRATLEGEGDAVVRALSATPTGHVLAVGAHDGTLVLGDAKLAGTGGKTAFVAALTPEGSVASAIELVASTDVRPLAVAGSRVVGTFAGSLEAGGHVLAASPASGAVFVLDVDAPTGTVASALALGGQGFTSPDGKLDAALDSEGKLVLAGSYVGGLAFDGCEPYPAKTKPNLFLAKLDVDGRCLWSVQNDDGAPQAIESVAVDALNDFVVVGGEFVGRLSFGAAPTLQNSGGIDLFIARFDGTGRLEWARSFGNGLVQGSARVAAAPGGYSALAGFFEGKLEFGAEPLEATRGHDVVIANFRPNGQLEWQRRVRVDRAPCEATPCELDELDLAFDPDGNLVVAVPFVGAAALDGVTVTADADAAATLLARFDRSGNLLWSGQLADAGSRCADRGHCQVSLAIDANRDVLLGGSFAGRLDFGGVTTEGPPSALAVDAAGERDGFVAKFLR